MIGWGLIGLGVVGWVGELIGWGVIEWVVVIGWVGGGDEWVGGWMSLCEWVLRWVGEWVG